MSSLSPENEPGESPSEENVFRPSRVEASFHLQASRYTVLLYRQIVSNELEKREELDRGAIEDILEEWDYVALCLDRLPTSEDQLKYGEILEELRSKYALADDLAKEATWNDIICNSLSEFDEPILVGIENGWPWERVLQLKCDTSHIDTALRYNADPDVSSDRLVELIQERAWEYRMSTRMLEHENERLSEQIKTRLTELNKTWGLPEDASDEKRENVINAKVRVYLSQVYNKPPDDVTEEEIADFLDRPGEES